MTLRRYGLLVAGVALTVLSSVCAFTPVVWILQGRPAGYPELFALIYLLPAAVVILAGGAAKAACTRWTRASSALFWIGIAVVLGLLAYGGLLLINPGLPPHEEFLVATPVGAVLAIYGWLTRTQA